MIRIRVVGRVLRAGAGLTKGVQGGIGGMDCRLKLELRPITGDVYEPAGGLIVVEKA